MTTKKLITIIITLVISLNIKSQIVEEIKSFVDSTELLVNNGRKMLFQKLKNKDIEKSKEIFYYLNETTKKQNSCAFYYSEKLLLSLLLGDFEMWKELTTNYNEKTSRRCRPYNNLFEQSLTRIIVDSHDTVLITAKKSNITDEDKDVITLFLHLTTHANDTKYYKLLHAYHKKYKQSKYSVFFKNYLPTKIAKTSISFSMGSGYQILTSKLGENFKANGSFNTSMDFNIDRIFTSLFLNVNSYKLKIPFQAESENSVLKFAEGDRFHNINAGLHVGYFLLRNKKYHISPYASILASTLESTKYKPTENDKELKIYDSFSYGVGMHTEVKLMEFKSTNYYGYQTDNFISLKLEAGYNVINEVEYLEYKGNNMYLNLCIVWGIGQF